MHPDTVVINFFQKSFVICFGYLRHGFICKPRTHSDDTVEIIFFVAGCIGFVFAAVEVPTQSCRRGQASLTIQYVFFCNFCERLIGITFLLICQFLFLSFKLHRGSHSSCVAGLSGPQTFGIKIKTRIASYHFTVYHDIGCEFIVGGFVLWSDQFCRCHFMKPPVFCFTIQQYTIREKSGRLPWKATTALTTWFGCAWSFLRMFVVVVCQPSKIDIPFYAGLKRQTRNFFAKAPQIVGWQAHKFTGLFDAGNLR